MKLLHLFYVALFLFTIAGASALTVEQTAGVTQWDQVPRNGHTIAQNTQLWGQTFNITGTGNYTINSFAVQINRTGSLETGNTFRAVIYVANSSGYPTATPVATSNVLNPSSVPLNTAAQWFNLTFNDSSLAHNTQYVIAITYNGTGTPAFRTIYNTAGGYANGEMVWKSDGGGWVTVTGDDLNFILTYDVSAELTIAATDLYDNSTISTFNASVTGTAEFISLLDKSGNGNTLTNNGATWNSTDNSYVWDGTAERLTATTPNWYSQRDVTTTSVVFTPSGLSNIGANAQAILGYADTGNTNRVYVTKETNGQLRVVIGNTGVTIANNGTYNINSVQSIIFVRDAVNNLTSAYFNGVLVVSNTSTPVGNPGAAIDVNLGSIGANTYFNGTISDVRVWNRSLSAAEVAVVYANGSVTDGLVALYDFDGYGTTNYTTTNGTINTQYIVNSSQPVNVTVSATDYFPATYSDYTTTSLNAELYQAIVGFTASEVVSGSGVTDFTVCASGGGCNTSTSPSLYLTAGTNTITFSKTGWFNKTFDINVTAVTSTNYEIEEVYQYLLNVSFRNVATGSLDPSFTLNITSDDYPYSEVLTTTTSYVLAPWTNDSFTLYAYDGTVTAATNATNSTYNLAVPSTYNITLDSYWTNSFILTFYNETTDEELTENVTLQLISPSYAVNVTVTGGATNLTLLVPTDYQMIYWVDPAVPREYYTTLTNQSVQTIRLYTIDEELRDLYVPVALSQFGQACSNQTVSLLRYFIDGNAYRIVEMAITDTNGAAVLSVQPNIINYKLQFSGSCGDYTSEPQKITSSSNSFTITDSQSPLITLEAFDSVSRSLTYNEDTDTFVFNWADSTNIVAQACLTVTKIRLGVRTTDYSSCTTAPSGSIIHTINDTNQTKYIATGVITLSSGQSFSDTTSADYNTGFLNFGDIGIFLTLLVLILFAAFGAASPDLMVMSGVLGIIIMGVMSFIAFDWTYFVGMVIVAFIIVYKTGRS